MVVEKGHSISVHYTGTFDDGTVFDTSRETEVIEFTVGAGQMIEGFDSAVIGMSIGESKKIHINAADAYDETDPSMLLKVSNVELPDDLQNGEGIYVQLENGEQVLMTLIERNNCTCVLDANYPMAAKDLNFDIEIISIKVA